MSRLPLLSNAQWELIAGLLAARSGRQGRPFSGARSMVEGTGVPVPVPTPWRDLPAVFGRWQRAWTWPRREAEDGTRDLIFATLTAAGDAVGPGGLVRAGGLDGRPPARTSTPRVSAAIWGASSSGRTCSSSALSMLLAVPAAGSGRRFTSSFSELVCRW